MITIDLNDSFILHDLAMKNCYEHGKFNKKLVIEDMNWIFIFTRDPYVFYLNTIVNNEITIQPRSDKDYLKILKSIVVGDYDKDNKTQRVNLKIIFEKGFCAKAVKNQFAVKDVRFNSKDDSDILNYFNAIHMI
jgi:hypothetical protein